MASRVQRPPSAATAAAEVPGRRPSSVAAAGQASAAAGGARAAVLGDITNVSYCGRGGGGVGASKALGSKAAGARRGGATASRGLGGLGGYRREVAGRRTDAAVVPQAAAPQPPAATRGASAARQASMVSSLLPAPPVAAAAAVAAEKPLVAFVAEGALAAVPASAMPPRPPSEATTAGDVEMPPALDAAMELYREAEAAATAVASEGAAQEEDAMEVDAAAVDVESQDPQCVPEYINDIYRLLDDKEEGCRPRSDYMGSQMEINAKMRSILVDWLIEVHMKYKLRKETLHLAIHLVDRYLSCRPVARRRLQLAGVGGMMIAAKFEEIYPPETRDFVYITDNAYTREDVLEMEVMMLTTLGFNLCGPTMSQYLDRMQKLLKLSEGDERLNMLHFLTDLALVNYDMLQYSPSHLVAAATLLSNKLLKVKPSWSDALARQTNKSADDLIECSRALCRLMEAAREEPTSAVWRKYSQPCYGAIAQKDFSA
eukprot:TRINITY_DN29439_c0_g2_i1.p1 TRINITY_DN29439_c0_g2~~TRINITY_DN29439_c0_g2_i1.p1  ORF type:complete len:487 (-),score=151.79 TRINITY_DN29439_c0_g2_i1:208-1668(-)